MSASASRPLRLAWMLLGGAACLLAVTPPASARPPQSAVNKIESAANRVGNFLYKTARKLEEPLPNPELRAVRPQRIYTVTTTPDYAADIRADQARLRPQRGSEEPPFMRVWDPQTQQWLPPGMVTQRRAYSSGGAVYSPGGGVTVTSRQPSMPAVRLQPRPGGSSPVITDGDVNVMSQPSETRYLDPYSPAATEAYSSTQRRNDPAAEQSASNSTLEQQPQGQMNSRTLAKPATPKPSTPAVYGTLVPGKPGFVYPPGVEQDSKNMLDVRGLTAGQKVRDPRNGQIFLVP
ncbi:hypothetical protein [Roseimicrobium sp. ORNL1]|uniref:hypothetical protein n=1 Tax=Roseimicrobium sp. ORNL1 TaxID=2711231 RepID=UPI00197E10AB|nr:hypothetical protein [Roseimicrobium sp. ORNL1]